jgi:NAD(P)-dependent dehydrogenase (short-subunit alcohol dehydrogenase family)
MTKETNIRGVYLMCDAFIRSLSAEGQVLPGTTINVASQMAFLEFSKRSSSSLSKMATIKLAQYIHPGQYNITRSFWDYSMGSES